MGDVSHGLPHPAFPLKLLGLCSVALLLAGCAETVAQNQPEAQTRSRTNMARREGVSPHGASVAVTDIQGLDTPISGDLSNAFAKQASAREINLTDSRSANYLVRGYLNSSPAEGGAAFSFVWDVYDAKKRRTQRIDDQIFVKDASPDRIDEAVVNQIAAQSADDLAAVLSNMPEAVAAASSSATKTVSEAETSGVTRVPASPAIASTAPQVPGIGVASSLR
jgi:hypothetical protein